MDACSIAGSLFDEAAIMLGTPKWELCKDRFAGLSFYSGLQARFKQVESGHRAKANLAHLVYK